MDIDPTRVPARTGRPRDRAVDVAILEATVALIADSGIHAVSVDAVASRAHAGKDTIYRRWPHKDQLMEAALGHALEAHPEVPSTGDPHADLATLLGALARALSRPPLATVLREAIAEAPRDPLVEASVDRFRQGHELAIGRLVASCLGHPTGDPATDQAIVGRAGQVAALLLAVLVGDRLAPGVGPDPGGSVLTMGVVDALLAATWHPSNTA